MDAPGAQAAFSASPPMTGRARQPEPEPPGRPRSKQWCYLVVAGHLRALVPGDRERTDSGQPGQPGQPGYLRPNLNVRGVHQPATGQERRDGRLTAAHPAPGRAGGRAQPDHRTWRSPDPVRQDLTPRRYADAEEPVDLAGACGRRDEAGRGRAPGRGATVQGGAQDPAGGRGQRRCACR